MTAATPSHEKGAPDDASGGQVRTTHNQSVNTQAMPRGDGGVGPRVEPAQPNDLDESARSQVRASARQIDVGKQAFEDETGPGTDTDRGPVLDQVYNEKLGVDRDDSPPRE
jgi:hypothetical protein